jgi:hypothetical protein
MAFAANAPSNNPSVDTARRETGDLIISIFLPLKQTFFDLSLRSAILSTKRLRPTD